MALNKISMAVRLLIVQLAIDSAKARRRRSSLTISGVGFIGGEDTRTLIGIDANAPVDVILHDDGVKGAQRAISISETDDCRRVGGGPAMKVTISGGGNVVGGHSGVSVPQGSNAELEVKENSTVSGGIYGVEERDAALNELKAALPANTPPDAIRDAIDAVQAVRNGTKEEMEEAVRGSRLWEWIKEYGPDVLGLAVKAGLSAFG
ncbi:hypothetical protein [Burkholderia cenocepacia]|uniref:hypothetical protein n=1 Tax=Burkholderia cenocepacia TaxID=95486 RepID=UPI002AC3265B|nr:hypothetical protein [Burkholderia cenocepacia]